MDNTEQRNFVFVKKGVPQIKCKTSIKQSFLWTSNKVFHQVIIIPMGLTPDPYFASFFYFYYANKWIMK